MHNLLAMTPDQIKAFRTDRKLSQAELAEKLGVDQATVSRIERGVAMPRTVELLLNRLMAEPFPSQPTQGEAA
jgi:DNA-binding transcriptional regulator YiaG